ncbi:hypothetical protein VARIO8X_160246 [Burkholderiales bacterium 8X]|nr:hypothetical protein VARIO8X_160246 [Burkholderiales bacterium 8X]
MGHSLARGGDSLGALTEPDDEECHLPESPWPKLVTRANLGVKKSSLKWAGWCGLCMAQ